MSQEDRKSAREALKTLKSLKGDLDKIVTASHHDPASILGRHAYPGGDFILFYSPGTTNQTVSSENIPTTRVPDSDFFVCTEQLDKIEPHYTVTRTHDNGHVSIAHDPYSFAPQLDDFDLHLFTEGKHLHIYNVLGAHPTTVDGIAGVLFSTWAPNASRVSVIGNFNGWDGRIHPMHCRGANGVWELFIPDITSEELYKFEIRNRNSGQILSKSDPYAQQLELRPRTASVVKNTSSYEWQDTSWMEARNTHDWLHTPLSIYECHLGSWQRDDHGHFLNYRELAHRLVGYVKEAGFTHIELLPITEHPLDRNGLELVV